MASTYLSWTGFSSTSTSWTYSGWVKRSKLGSTNYLISWGTSGTDGTGIGFDSGDNLFYYSEDSPSNILIETSAVYRDTSAWYHIVVRCNAGAITIYVNGESVKTGTGGNPLDTSTMAIGKWVTSAYYHDGSMAHVHFVDGTAYDADTFGETDSSSGIWKPKTAPSVTYGTNGFFLKFQDSSSLGDDSSGNTNDFTLSGSGTQTLDTPSNVFATFSPLHFGDTNPSSYGTFSNGNTRYASTQAGSPYPYTCSTLAASSGKWYAEFKITQVSNSMMVGITDGNKYQYLANNNNKDVALFYDGNKYPGNSSFGNAFSDNDICGVAMDLDNMKVYFSKNGVWQNSGDPTSGASGTGAADIPTGGLGQFHFAFGDSGGNTTSCNANFGNGYFGTTAVSSAENDDAGYGKFEYDVPAGYYALCTKNINTYG